MCNCLGRTGVHPERKICLRWLIECLVSRSACWRTCERKSILRFGSAGRTVMQEYGRLTFTRSFTAGNELAHGHSSRYGKLFAPVVSQKLAHTEAEQS